MPSSTSSSDERRPVGGWPATLALAAVVLVGGAVAMEAGLRVAGYGPSVSDDAKLWALIREDMPPNEERLVAFVGSSRTQTDIDMDRFAEQTGTQPVMLAIVHASSQPVLHNLAQDESFVGDVVLELSPTLMFVDDPSFFSHVEQRIRTRTQLQRSLFGFLEKRAVVAIQERLTCLNSQLDLPDLAVGAVTGSWPTTPTVFRPDRERFFNGEVQPRLPDVPAPAASEATGETSTLALERIDEIAADIQALRARGSRVLLVHYPSRGDTRNQELRDFPRAFYWDIAEARFGVPSMHWTDLPDADTYQTHDYSHLDQRDAARFTDEVAQVWNREIGPR